MKIKLTKVNSVFRNRLLFIIMKTFIFLLCTTVFGFTTDKSFSQEKVTIDVDKVVPVDEVFSIIQKQTKYRFIYPQDMFANVPNVQLKKGVIQVSKLLDQSLAGSNVNFKLSDDNTIVIKENRKTETLKSSVVQQHQVSGTITDQAGLTLPSANIMEKGTNNGVQSDLEGKFKINVQSSNAILVVSFLGFVTKEIAVNNQTIVDVVLQENPTSLDDVVVVGYGTQNKSKITGAVGVITAKDLEKRTVTDVRQALQGSIPGLTIIDRGGAPGSEGFDLKIRGVGTIGNSEALVLIDGVERSMSNLDSDDVESISVLKDAVTAAIYGARAANGVVLITTKRATKKGLKIDYNGYFGLQQPSQRQEFLGARDYLELINESLVNNGRPIRFSEDYIQRTEAGNDSNYPYTDLWNKIVGQGSAQDHSIRLLSGGEKSNTYASINYLDQVGLLGNFATHKRFIFNLNNTFNISEKLKFSTDFTYVNKDFEAPNDYGIGWALGDPLVTLKYNNGLYGFNTKNDVSPLARLEQSGSNKQSVLDLSTRFKLEYKIVKDLKLTGFVGYINNLSSGKSFRPFVEFPDPRNPEVILTTWTPSSVQENRNETNEMTVRFLLDYKLSANKNNLDLLAGFEQIENKWNGIDTFRDKLYSNDFPQISFGDPASATNNGGAAEWGLRSYFGRLAYNYNEKYFLESTVRYDGSSRFAEGNKWGVFPAFSLGWAVSKENFMKSFEKLKNFKIRGSYGTLGNQNIGLFRYASIVYPGFNYAFGNQLVSGYNTNNYANKDISWESTTTLNIGTDLSFSLLGGSVDINFDWFRRETDDVLLSLPIPMIVGLSPSETNAGKVKNQGWEFFMSYKNYTHDLGYKIGFNLSDVKNEVVDLAGLNPIIGGNYVLKEGYPIWAPFGWQSNGLFVDQADIDASPKQPNSANVKPGDIKFVDRNNDGVVNDDDRYVMDSSFPRFTFGLNTEFTYKGFDLVAFFQGTPLAHVYLTGSVNDGPQFQNAATTRFLDRWSPSNPNPNASMPRITADNNYNNTFANDFWLRDAKYVRLKNLQIGYNFKEAILNKIGTSALRIFVAGTNIFTLSNIESGLDPESGYGASYPTLSTYTIGLDIKF
jgi:TonB-linked SusC/RagA family outer membrane protein